MTPVVPTQGEEVQILTGISWEEYKRRNDAVEGRSPRMTYDGGVLELITLGAPHERLSWFIGRLFEELADEFDIDYESLKSTTLRRDDLEKSFESDGCYYVYQADRIRAKDQINLPVDPPPDLIIEVDISRNSMPKRKLFAAMGIGELWQFRRGRLRVFLLRSATYQEAEVSQLLPGVRVEQLNELLAARQGRAPKQWHRIVRDWARVHRPTQS
jgi:Uma2 family endonuclease